MQPLMKRNSIITAGVLIGLALVCAYLYRNRPRPQAVEIEAVRQGEPEIYSAMIIRTVDDGTRREEFALRRVRSGELWREEWSKPDAGALIWRPDLGKYFRVDFDRREYVEESINPVIENEPSSSARNEPLIALPTDAIYKVLLDAPLPEKEETHSLADQTIDNHLCNVVERRETFADGHVETTRMYLARDLNGLPIRIESESNASREKVVTVRRDIRTEVSAEEFAIPTGFKKVESLRR
jgi:hypothetical protein